MISKITGRLTALHEDEATLAIDHFEYEVLIPELVRRQLQRLVGEPVTLHTVQYIEGGAMQGRMIPRLVGFFTEAEREFFDLFCSVDGVGVRKALKAMVRSVKDIATAIQEQDTKTLSTLPGIGEATAERIIAKLRRKVAKFALIVERVPGAPEPAAEPDVIQQAYQALLTVGHSPPDARRLLDRALAARKKFSTVQDLLEEIYRDQHPHR